jgi:hypothetical protein
VSGPQTGSANDATEMLVFTARHGLKPIIETFAMGQCRPPLGFDGATSQTSTTDTETTALLNDPM